MFVGLTFIMSSNVSNSFDINKKIKTLFESWYWKNYVISSYENYMYSHEINVKNSEKMKTYDMKTAWISFIKDAIKQILLFGYVVWYKDYHIPVVICGTLVVPRRINGKDVLYVNESNRLNSVKKKIYYFNFPFFDDDGYYIHPTSSAWNVRTDLKSWCILNHNLHEKDRINTRPGIYLSNPDTKGINERQRSNEEGLASAKDNMTFGNITEKDRWVIVANNMIERGNLSNSVIEETDNIEGHPYQLKANDGCVISEIRHLQQDNTVVNDTMTQLSYAIMQGLGVPPQASGITRNSERNPSTKTTTNITISYFNDRAEMILNTLNMIYRADGNNSDMIIKVMQYQTIERHKLIMKPKELIKSIALSEKVDANIFDEKLVKAEQACALGMVQGVNGSGSGSMSYTAFNPAKRIRTDKEESDITTDAKGKRIRSTQSEDQKNKTDDIKYGN